MENETEKYEFDDMWQAKVVALGLRGRDFYTKHKGIIKADYFESQHLRDIYSLAEEYYNEFDTDGIDKDVLRNIVSRFHSDTKIKNADLDSYLELIESLYGYEISDLERAEPYSSKIVIDFARRQAMKIVMLEAAKDIDEGRPMESIPENLMKPLAIGADLDAGYDYFDELVPRVYRTYEASPSTVRTGFRELDHALGGGLRPGELGIFVGPPGRGKTAMLVNIVAGAMIARKSVLYFILEGDKEDLAVRLDMRLSRIVKDELVTKQPEVKDFVTYFHKMFKTRFVIKQYGTETVTVSELAQFTEYLRLVDGWVPDLIIVDYLNICRRSNPREDIYLGRNYSEGKAWAVKINKPIWSAVQAKIGSLSEKILRPQFIAEATGRIWAISDIIIGLCQTEEEAGAIPPTMRLFVGKNRNREARQEISINFDKHRMLMEETPIGAQPTLL